MINGRTGKGRIDATIPNLRNKAKKSFDFSGILIFIA
jgi:hypothetical protein